MPIWKAYIGELISECLAVFIIITLGCSVAGMYVLYDPSPYQNAYWGVCIAWGMSVTIAIYVTGAVSGTHAEPGGYIWRWLCIVASRSAKCCPIAAAQIPGRVSGRGDCLYFIRAGHRPL